jgi:hypothetical protein
VLGTAAGVSLAVASLGTQATRNRLLLTRAAWAREACAEILVARYAKDRSVQLVDTVDLGRGTWCRAALEDVNAKLDVNLATPEALRLVLGNDTLVDALLDWRDADDVERPLGAEAAWYQAHGRRVPRNGPLAAVSELRYVRGGDSASVAELERVLTTRGTGQLALNTAPLEVLLAIPGMTVEAVEVLRDFRLVNRSARDADEFIGRLSPPARSTLLERYGEFMREAAFAPARFTLLLEGGVTGFGGTSRGWLTVVPTAGRLAVIRREME